MTDSQNLLAEFVQSGSESVFRELVDRYVDLVYSTALRLVGGDTHRAEDVAQIVFLDLVRLARTLPESVKLGGWLHRDTCFVAAKLMRGERRRQFRERQAVEMNALQNDSGPDCSQLAPMLDEAINSLDEADRTAVLLRFFEQHDFRTIGEALGSNEDAARMRVNRAVEKLESLLNRRGAQTTVASLAVMLSAGAVHSAPVGLAATISTASVLAGTALSTSTVTAATKAITMTTLQKALVTATVVVLAGVGIYEARQASQLRNRVQTLQKQQAPLIDQARQLERERDDATKRLAVLAQETEKLKSHSAELLQLRGEVTRLRAAAQKLTAEASGNAQTNGADVALQMWLKRVKDLKHLPERMPDKVIPELKLLNEEDWLGLAKTPEGLVPKASELDGDAAARRAFSAVRAEAKNKLMKVLSRALEGYANANGGQLPTDTLQLKPYLMNKNFEGLFRAIDIEESVVDESVLSRYEMLLSGKLQDVPSDLTIMAERSPVDGEYDTRLRVGKYWIAISGLETYDPVKGAKMD